MPFETKSSKMKMGLVVIGSLCFMALGYWLAFYPEQFADSRRGGIAPFVGWLCLLVFGFLVRLG